MDIQQYIGSKITGSPSAAGNWLQFTLDHIEKGAAEISLDVRTEMTNPYKHIHGGMMALVIDECIGMAVFSLGSSINYTTLNLNIDYLYGIADGERLVAKSKVIREGKKIVNVECVVYNMEHKLLAKASSNLIATGMHRGRISEQES